MVKTTTPKITAKVKVKDVKSPSPKVYVETCRKPSNCK